MRPLVIIHGWSDEAKSFVRLGRAIEKRSGRSVLQIWLGNYVSLDDDVQMSDLVRGLTHAWQDCQLPTAPGSVDVIVHSTGGLVIRDWMHTQWQKNGGQMPPVNNLVMLAPANFGSPLAHKGRAFYGRVLKGFQSHKRFETGTHILKSLEMASPYTWELAHRDRFESDIFSASGVRASVIIGNKGYDGIQSIANESGSDGTVYVATADLNCGYLRFRFPIGDITPELVEYKSPGSRTALLVVDNFNHSTIALKAKQEGGQNQRLSRAESAVLDNIVEALSIEDAVQFDRWADKCEQASQSLLSRYSGYNSQVHKHGFQNTLFRVSDDQGFPVHDYVIEFYHDVTDLSDKIALKFNRDAVSTVHTCKFDSSYRSFMIDCTRLAKIIDKPDEHLKISLSATPDLNDDKTVVGYRTFGSDDIGCVTLNAEDVKKFFVPNRTLLVDITLTRDFKTELFRIEPLSEFQ